MPAVEDQLWEIPVWLHYSTILLTSPREKGLLNIWEIEFDFLFKCIDVDGRSGGWGGWGGGRDSASRCSLDGHQGNLPSFSNWSTGLLGCLIGGRFGKVSFFERLLTATMSWWIIDHFNFFHQLLSNLLITACVELFSHLDIYLFMAAPCCWSHHTLS